jgi:hypothetical protein
MYHEAREARCPSLKGKGKGKEEWTPGNTLYSNRTYVLMSSLRKGWSLCLGGPTPTLTPDASPLRHARTGADVELEVT